MSKSIHFAAAALFAVGLSLAAPALSRADDWDFGGRGYGNGPRHGYGGYGGYSWGQAPGYSSFRFGQFGNFGSGCDASYYGGYRSRPIIVHPESLHWTPGRGWHEHGHIHVPHRGHYHTRPY